MDRPALGVGDLDVHELTPGSRGVADRLGARMSKWIAVDHLVGLERRQLVRVIGAGSRGRSGTAGSSAGPAGDVGIDVDEHAVGPGSREGHRWRSIPLAGIGGWSWMMYARSSRTMIRCTPVCGPEPVLYWVSGLPFGQPDVERHRRRVAGDDRAGGREVAERERLGGRDLGHADRGRPEPTPQAVSAAAAAIAGSAAGEQAGTAHRSAACNAAAQLVDAERALQAGRRSRPCG